MSASTKAGYDASGQNDTIANDTIAAEHAWLRLGAWEKAKSVTMLSRGLPINSVLEIGSGTGALLEQLDNIGFAREYYAVEPSVKMYQFMMKRAAISRLVAAESSTLQECSFLNKHFDLGILSHVLEHLEEPAALLRDALQLVDYLIVEVPLDGNWFGNLRAKARTAITHVPRRNNVAGHIQFFSRSDVHSLVTWCGGEVVSFRLHVPLPQMRRAMTSGSPGGKAYARLSRVLSRTLGQRYWAEFYHGHYAVLIRPRGTTAEHERTNWTPAYYIENQAANG